MARPPNADGRHTRQAILDKALVLFADRGFFGTSLRDIAEAVGVRESALYNYFTGKEALFAALVTAAQEDRTERLAALVDRPDEPPRALLERLTGQLLDDFTQARQQQLFRVLLSDGMRLAREGRINLIDRMTSAMAPLHELMRLLASRGQVRRRAPEVLVAEFMGPLLMWRHWHALDPDGALVADRRAFARAHVDHFLTGAAGRAPARRTPSMGAARAARAPSRPAVAARARRQGSRSRG